MSARKRKGLVLSTGLKKENIFSGSSDIEILIMVDVQVFSMSHILFWNFSVINTIFEIINNNVINTSNFQTFGRKMYSVNNIILGLTINNL